GVTAAAIGVGLLGKGTVSGGIGPNDTIRAAVIGVHGRGGAHISGFRGHPKVEVVALCDIDEKVLNDVANDMAPKSKKKDGQGTEESKDTPPASAPEWKKPALYTDLRKMLDDKS